MDYEKNNNHNIKYKSSLACNQKNLDIHINMAHIKGFHFTQNISYLILLDFFSSTCLGFQVTMKFNKLVQW